MKLMLIAALCFAALLHTSEAIKCYECNAATCLVFDEDADSYKEDCPPADKVCFKTEAAGIVTRGCGNNGLEGKTDACQKMTFAGVVDTDVCVCNTDYCNSASLTNFNILTAVAIIASVKYFF